MSHRNPIDLHADKEHGRLVGALSHGLETGVDLNFEFEFEFGLRFRDVATSSKTTPPRLRCPY